MTGIPIHATVVVVVEHAGRYLMALEERGGPDGPVWYFPSGALSRGETLAEAARRETLEETGYLVEPLRVIRIEHGTFPAIPELFWWRFIVSARLVGDEPRSSTGAGVVAVEWLELDAIPGQNLRASDALQLALSASAAGGLDIGAVVLSPQGTLEGFIA